MKNLLLFAMAFVFCYTLNAQPSLKYKGGVHVSQNLSKDYVALYEQFTTPGSGYASQDFETANDAYDCMLADDFVIPVSESWNIDSVVVVGSWNGGIPLDLVHVFFMADNTGIPGDTLFEFFNLACSSVDNGGAGPTLITLPSRVVLDEGTYWIAVQAKKDYGTFGQWYWTTNSPVVGTEGHFINPGGGFGGANTWTSTSTYWGTAYDFSFGLYEILSDGFNVTFNVDMTDSINSGYFVEGTDVVYIAGNMSGAWAEPGQAGSYLMTESATDNIYTYTMPLADGPYEYKYFKNTTWTNGEWNGGGNRTFTMAGADLTLNDVFGVLPVGVSNLLSGITVFPNPSNGIFHVSVNSETNMDVYDISGKLINSQILKGSSRLELKNSGVYLIRFSNNEGSSVQRVIVK